MKNTEYILTVSKPIMRLVSEDLSSVFYKAGKTITLNETDFTYLKNGGTITRYLNEGLIIFNKNDFENEVRTLIVTTELGTTKLNTK